MTGSCESDKEEEQHYDDQAISESLRKVRGLVHKQWKWK